MQTTINWGLSLLTPTRVISAAIGIAGLFLAIRRERKRSHLEIFLVKGSAAIHVKNVGSTDALDVRVDVLGKDRSAPFASGVGHRLKKDDELKVPLDEAAIPKDGMFDGVVTYRNPNDKEGKVRKRRKSLHYVQGMFEGAQESSPITAPMPPPSRTRVAFLPLANISPDPADEYFSDGMTEELIDRLSKVRGLRVIARTSVMAYKQKVKKASEIGRELGVGSLVEGSVRKAGNKIRITVQLVDVGTEEHLWSSVYDKDLDDVFAIQSEIAEKVSSELKIQLMDSDKQVLEKRPIENSEAYTLYLKGRYYWNERSKESNDAAVNYFLEAVSRAPEFALAYSALADCYAIYTDFGWQEPTKALPKARAYALKAIEFDPHLAEPHATLGLIMSLYDFDWENAESEIKKALELKESYATAHHWYSVHLRILGRLEESLGEIRQAAELDPLSRVILAELGEQLLAMGKYEKAVKQLEEVVETNPEFAAGHCSLAWGYYMLTRQDDALAEMRKAVTVSGHDSFYEAELAALTGFTGHSEDADRLVDALISRSELEYMDKVSVAFALFGSGRADEAFAYMEKGFGERSHLFLYFRTKPWFNRYLSDPRWLAFESKLRLPKTVPPSSGN